jgi:multidrug efflux system membrane fusion protein
VVAAAARTTDMPVYLTGLGAVTALNTVTVRTRVDGELVKVAFKEGELVHEGDVLAQVDPRPYEVQLLQAQGQMQRDQASLTNAKVDLQRYEEAKEAVTGQQIATAAAAVDQFEGAVKSDEAQIENAKLNLTYSRITAPITGRIGLRLVDQGNMVHANDLGGLAVITQVQPIAVIFYLPEDNIAQVIRQPNAGSGLVVEAYDRDLKNSLATGSLLTIDNQIDPATGTVRLKAIFGNEDGALFPNQFVNARLLIDVRRGAVVVPTAAVQRSPSATYVYVVKADDTVELRNVKIGPSEGDGTLIEQHLEAGEVVVTDGVDKLQDGTKVSVRRSDAPAEVPAPATPTAAAKARP